MADYFPHVVDCYLMVMIDGLPTQPDQEPVASEVVHSDQDVQKVKKRFEEEHPDSWVVQRPMD